MGRQRLVDIGPVQLGDHPIGCSHQRGRVRYGRPASTAAIHRLLAQQANSSAAASDTGAASNSATLHRPGSSPSY